MPTPEFPVHTNALPRIGILAGLRAREDVAFSNASGKEKPSLRKRAEKDLQQASEVLPRLLQPSEAVLYVARGAFMPNTLEQILEHNAAMASGALLVLTNQRLIVLRTKSSGFTGWKWDDGILTVEWTSLAVAAKKGWVISFVDLRDQTKRRERFFRMSWQDTKKLGLLLGLVAPRTPGLAPAVQPGAQGFTSLCPKCLAKLSPSLYRCGQCGQVFKDEKSLLTRALLVPGGSYFYTGQRLLGLFAGLVEAFFLFAIGLCLAQVAGLIPMPSDVTLALTLTRMAIWLPFLAAVKFAGFYRGRVRVKRFIPA